MTHVIFKREDKDGTPIAFFPGLDANPGSIVCYAHIGQHSEASLEYYWSLKNPKTEDVTKIDSLFKELQSIGYDDLVKRKRRSYR